MDRLEQADLADLARRHEGRKAGHRARIDDDSGEAGAIAQGEAFALKALLPLAVATSIDALAVGVSFAFLDVTVWAAVLVIGVTTFVLSFVAVLVGHRVGARFRRPGP